MGEQDNIQKGAREVADLLKDGKTKEAGERLRDDFQHMGTQEFKDFLHAVKDMNAGDQKVNRKLPGIVFHETRMEGADAISEVAITTPGKIFGNLWRNSETVVKSEGGSGMLGNTTAKLHGRRAELEDALAADRERPSAPIEQRKGQ